MDPDVQDRLHDWLAASAVRPEVRRSLCTAKRKLRPMTFEYGCELLRWLEEAETYVLRPLQNGCN